MPKDCLICQRIAAIRQNENPYLVRELATGYVVLADSQYFEGYTLFLAKGHVTELHELAPKTKLVFLEEMSLVAEACSQAFHADKMNIELLGNGDAHVHWHLFPRHAGDTAKPGPVWWTPMEQLYGDDVAADPVRLGKLKAALNQALDAVLLTRVGELGAVHDLTLSDTARSGQAGQQPTD